MSKNLLKQLSKPLRKAPTGNVKHPVLLVCNNCGHKFASAEAEPVCPKCFSDEVEIVNK